MSLLRARQCAGQGRVKAGVGCARSGQDAGMWAVHVGSLAGEGRAHQKGNVSGGTVEAQSRPQTRRSVILGDEAPMRHGLRDLLLRTTKMGL
jgi:hypothetical protein